VTANKPSVLAKPAQADHLQPAAGTALPSALLKRFREEMRAVAAEAAGNANYFIEAGQRGSSHLF
jgi:hypothetical protein